MQTGGERCEESQRRAHLQVERESQWKRLTSEDGLVGSVDVLSDLLSDLHDRLGITGSVGEEESVELRRETRRERSERDERKENSTSSREGSRR